jgi:hypothetical protein
MHTTRRRLIVLLTTFVLAAPVAARADWPNDPGQMAPVSTLPAVVPVAVADGFGGTIVVWLDQRNGNVDVYAQRLDGRGNPMWAVNGVPVCTAPNTQNRPDVIADGAGGALVTWDDARDGIQRDIYVMHLLPTGAPNPTWPLNGQLISSQIRDESDPRITTDGAGGAYVGYDRYFPPPDIDPYVTHVGSDGLVGVSNVGSSLGQAQYQSRVVSDGSGGVILLWLDERSGPTHVYAQRFVSGLPQWTSGGVLMYGTTSVAEMNACSDGAGGAYAAFPGSLAETYVARVLSNGLPAWALSASGAYDGPSEVQVRPDGMGGVITAWRNAISSVAMQRFNAVGAKQWGQNGIQVRAFGVGPAPAGPAGSAGSAEVRNVQLVVDDAGGAVASWIDFRDLNAERVYAQRVSVDGFPLWISNGALVANAFLATNSHALARDSRSGAVVFVAAGNATSGIHSQRVGPYGQVGLPEPRIVSVRDVPNDQGGAVSIRWDASYLDRLPWNQVYAYRVWRQVPEAQALARIEAGVRVTGPTAEGSERRGEDALEAPGGVLLRTAAGTSSYYWELAGTQPASALAQYSFTTSTSGDSIAGSNPLTFFMVQAWDGGANGYVWNSDPDSGYSVDNLAPPTPSPFTAQYSGSSTLLQWGAGAGTVPDFAYYEVNRGVTSDFVPSGGTQIARISETSLLHAWSQPAFYKLAAVDIHGNRSPYALASTPGTVDAPAAEVPAFLWLAPASPNPTPRGAAIRFGLPRADQVSLELFDTAGRRLRVLADAALEPGEHVLLWNGLDDGGRRVHPGLVLIRLRAGGETITGRVMVVN